MSVQTVSSLLFIAGYFMLWVSVTSSTWRTELGWDYTLWERCDRHGCQHQVCGMRSYLAYVRLGAMISLICYSLTVGGLFLQHFTCKCQRTWHKRLVSLWAVLAELSLAPSLGLYGFKTVMRGRGHHFPVLGQGFTLCACAVMLALGGSIFRVMGPVRTWDDGLSWLLPKDGLLLENRLKYLRTVKRRNRRMHYTTGHRLPLLAMCEQRGNTYYAYTSVASSSRSRTLTQDGWPLTTSRHAYEQIDVSDMPAPPPEMLDPPPPPPPPPLSPLSHVAVAPPSQQPQPPPCPAPRTRDMTMPQVTTRSERSDFPRRPKRHRQHNGSFRQETVHRHLNNRTSPAADQDVRYHTMPVKQLECGIPYQET